MTGRASICTAASLPARSSGVQLADFIEAGDARFENGLLSIALKRVVPEAMKPRKIEIAGGTGDSDQLEAPKGENSAAA